MHTTNPKIGILFFSAEWFSQIGAERGSFSALRASIESDMAAIRARLRQEFQLVDDGILTRAQQVIASVKRFQSEEVDGVILCNVTWGEDRLVIDAVDRLESIPLLLWCYSPFQRLPEEMSMCDLLRSSGAVGALQASAPLKRLGTRVVIVVGSHTNDHTIVEIVCFGKAAKLVRDLRGLRIGVLPYRCDQMTGTFVDEFRLRKELGPQLAYISVAEYRDACNSVSESRLQDFVSYLTSHFCVAESVAAATLTRNARATLGLCDLATDHNIQALALEDVSRELHQVMGLRPCLSSPELSDALVISMEADICGALSLWVLKKITNNGPMYSEIFTFDETDNCLLIGHAGLHDITLASSPAEVLIEPDGEYAECEPESCWMSFRVKPGPVTLLSTFCDVKKFKFIISSGECLPGKRKILGSPHGYVRLGRPVAEFFRDALHAGMTQHWAMVHDEVIRELSMLAHLLDLDTVML